MSASGKIIHTEGVAAIGALAAALLLNQTLLRNAGRKENEVYFNIAGELGEDLESLGWKLVPLTTVAR